MANWGDLTALYVHNAPGRPEGFIGYGRMGVKITAALEAAGIEIYDEFNAPGTPEHFHVYADRKAKPEQTNVVAWFAVPAHCRGWYEGQVSVLMSMWEATKLPETYRENLEEFDTIVVPSLQNQELFSKYHPNVHMVPLGVDPTEWHPMPRPQPGAFFDFLIGGSGGRKGVDLAHKAFGKVFPEGSWGSGPIPRLIMKSPKATIDLMGDPTRYIQINGFLPLDVEVGLYAASHVYVQPSRGEGFGLQPLQAMAQGMPTILTGAHGHASFSHLGMAIDSELVPAGYFIAGDAGDWWEPDFDQLCDMMRWSYDNYDTCVADAAVAAEVIAEQFTWAQTAEGFLDAVGREHFAKPYTGSGEWHTPYLKRYPIITNRDMVCDVAGTVRRFKKGELTYDVADVKRLLWEGGRLDPACLDPNRPDDLGLNESQTKHLQAYIDRYSYCESCGQPLGGHLTKADKIFAELEANVP